MTDQLDRLKIALVDRYTIERELGRGGMATVYLAQDSKHHRPVAIKVLDPELARALGAERFLREVEVTANLNHPHILPLHDSGEADGFLFYVMPYVEGETLRERINRERQLPLDDAMQITREVASALSYAHSHDVIHRDIKPENILLSAGEAVVADFGIARAITEAGGEHLTETGISIGTPAYMSPEQASAEAKLDGRSDIYALGCVLYEMLAGEPPYTGPTAQAIVAKKLSEAVPRVSVVRERVPSGVEAAIEQALAKAPADRFTTAQQLIEALSAERVSAGAAPTPPKRRLSRRAVAGVVAVGVTAVAALAVWQYRTAMADSGLPPPDRPYTVLAAVEGSADSAVRETIGYAFRTGLDASHVIQTVPATEVERFLGLMDRPATTVLDNRTAHEMAERRGIPTVVLPRMDQIGRAFLFTVRVEDVSTKQLRAEASGQAADETEVVDVVYDAVLKLRRDLGESRAVLANTEPLPEVMTRSLRALQNYHEAVRLRELTADSRRFVPLLLEAVAEDTAFAMAWAMLAMSTYPDASQVATRQALRFPERLTDARRYDLQGWELMRADISYWGEALGSMCRGPQTYNCALMLHTFGLVDSALTIEMQKLAERVRRERALDPSRVIESCSQNPWHYAVSTGRLEEWRGFLDSLGVTTPSTCAPTFELWSRLAGGDWSGADSLLQSVTDVWQRFGEQELHTGQLDAARGRIGSARGTLLSMPRVLLDVVYGHRSTVPQLEWTDPVPWWQGGPGVPPEASRRWSTVEAYALYGLRSALLGDTSEAKRVSARLRALRDSATSERFEQVFGPWFVLTEVGPAARRGDWRSVIEYLGPWTQHVRQPGYGWGHSRKGGHSYLTWWLLAEAHAQLGQLDSAIVYLESIVGPPEDEWCHYGVAYSPAHFKLGQLYAQKGDREDAIDHFTTFLDTFTDPDPEYVWMVEEARAEVERLGRGR